MDVNAEYPTPGYPWTSGAAVDAEPELPALELEREVVGVPIRISPKPMLTFCPVLELHMLRPHSPRHARAG